MKQNFGAIVMKNQNEKTKLYNVVSIIFLITTILFFAFFFILLKIGSPVPAADQVLPLRSHNVVVYITLAEGTLLYLLEASMFVSILLLIFPKLLKLFRR